MKHRGMIAASGMLGACGIGLASLASHGGGGPALMTAGLLLVVHACALVALAALGRVWPEREFAWTWSAALLASGATLFALDLTLRAFAEVRLFPGAAPTGGLAMIAGWIWLFVAMLIGKDKR